jgi:hypothetical protein
MVDVIERKSTFTPMAEGIHLVTVTKAENLGEVDGQFGKSVKRQLYFENAEGEDIRKTYYGTKQLLADGAVLLGSPNARFDFTSLVGRTAQIVVTHVTKGDKTYANVTAIAKAPASAKAAVVAKSKAVPVAEGADPDLGF